jgi:hypothetical protein
MAIAHDRSETTDADYRGTRQSNGASGMGIDDEGRSLPSGSNMRFALVESAI